MDPMFDSGDQDYDSAAGWAPGRQWVDVGVEDRERNPRKYSPAPVTPRRLHDRQGQGPRR